MDNKSSVRALAKSAIARTFIMFLLLFCFNSKVFANDIFTNEEAQKIIDFFSDVENICDGTEENISNIAENFADIPLENIDLLVNKVFEHNSNFTLNNLTMQVAVSPSDNSKARIYFTVSNMTFPGTINPAPYYQFYEASETNTIIKGYNPDTNTIYDKGLKVYCYDYDFLNNSIATVFQGLNTSLSFSNMKSSNYVVDVDSSRSILYVPRFFILRKKWSCVL